MAIIDVSQTPRYCKRKGLRIDQAMLFHLHR